MAAPAPGAPAQQQPNEFDLARKRAQQQNNAAVQQQRDAIKRRAAAQGGLNSGAFIKQEQQVLQKGQEQLGQANEQIDTAQRAEARRIKEIEDQRAFQASESKLARDLQAEQFAKQYGLSELQFKAAQEQFGKQFGLQQSQLEAQTTGKYKGADGKEVDTLAKQQLDWTKGEATQDRADNKLVNMVTTALSGKNSGLSPEAINSLIEALSTGELPPGWPNIQGPAAAPTTVEQTMTQTGPGGEKPVAVQSDNRGTIAIYQDSKGRYVYRNGRKQYI